MIIARHLKQAGLALVMLSSVGVLQGAYAAGTTAGTVISNTATVNYSVGSVAQTAINSNVAEFVVDNRVDLSLVRDNTAPVTAAPNQTGVVATFTLANEGNSTQSYQLVATNIATAVFGNNDSTDVTLTTAWDSNGNGSYDVGDATGNTGDIVPGAGSASTTVRVFVLATVPGTATNGQFASVNLVARAATAGSNGSTVAVEDNGVNTAMGAPQIVFADAGEDNSETADNQYSIVSAALTVTKSFVVISDPINNTTNPKAIPGAVVEYTTVIQNNGAVAAANLTMTDSVPTEATYVANSLTLNGSAAGTVTGNAISVPVATLAASGTATIVFRVTIN